MSFTITSTTTPECEAFLKIKKDDAYYTIADFIAEYRSDTDDILNDCVIGYRGTEKSYRQMVDDDTAFSDRLEFHNFQKPMMVFDEAIRAAIYFAKKAGDCLQFARFFTMKSASLFDLDCNLHWSQGYVPQYHFRCIYFGTATTWYSNCFDQILQIVYWGFELYTSVADREGNAYNESWNTKKIMECCTYEFVVSELKTRGLIDIRKYLTACSSQIEEVRKWANYIKHKGGIDYKHLEAPSPYSVTIQPIDGGEPTSIDDFKSPVEVDIDSEIPKLRQTHIAIHQCLSAIIAAVDFDGHSLRFVNKEEHPNE
jgi:hypothetical protein